MQHNMVINQHCPNTVYL